MKNGFFVCIFLLIGTSLFGQTISVYGYNLSPDNERALIVIKAEYSYMEGGYRFQFTGCNLRVGF